MGVEVEKTLINGKWTLILPRHRAARAEWRTGWEAERLDSMRANLRPGMVVYDVGAEEGDLSALFASWVEPGGGVVLVEPNPRVWPNIRLIWEANALDPPLLSVVGFCAERDERLERLEAPGWPACASGPVIADHGFLNVMAAGHLPVVTVDTLAAGLAPPPDAVTMDVEGAEILVARGMRRTLAEHRPLVWVSVHAEAMFHDWGAYQVELFSEFHRHGYEKRFLSFDHEAHWFFYPAEREVVV